MGHHAILMVHGVCGQHVVIVQRSHIKLGRCETFRQLDLEVASIVQRTVGDKHGDRAVFASHGHGIRGVHVAIAVGVVLGGLDLGLQHIAALGPGCGEGERVEGGLAPSGPIRLGHDGGDDVDELSE